MKRLWLAAWLATFSAPAAAQYERAGASAHPLPRGMVVGGALRYGSPQGEFAQNVNAAFGLNGFLGWQLFDSPLFVRADLGWSMYGSETRTAPLGTGALSLIAVDITTTNNILHGSIGLQAGAPGNGLRPYVGGSVGFADFFTTSSVRGSMQSSGDAFASSTNLSDGAFATTAFGGFFIPIGNKGAALDLGARYHWQGEARYLTERDISFDRAGKAVLSPRRSRADLLTIHLGLAYKRR